MQPNWTFTSGWPMHSSSMTIDTTVRELTYIHKNYRNALWTYSQEDLANFLNSTPHVRSLTPLQLGLAIPNTIIFPHVLGNWPLSTLQLCSPIMPLSDYLVPKLSNSLCLAKPAVLYVYVTSTIESLSHNVTSSQHFDRCIISRGWHVWLYERFTISSLHETCKYPACFSTIIVV